MSMDGARAGTRRQGARKANANRSDRKCPRCLRLGGLGSRLSLGNYAGAGTVRVCRYCGHEVGISDGEFFGRDVTPEPGARGGTHLPERTTDEPDS